MSLSLNLAIVFGVIEIVLGLSVSAQAQDVPDDINSARCVTRAPEGASTQELERFLDACFQCREEIIRNYNNRRLTANQMIEEYNRVVEQLREVTPLALEYQRRNTERANSLENQQLRLRQEQLEAEYQFLVARIAACRAGNRSACAQATPERIERNNRERHAYNQVRDEFVARWDAEIRIPARPILERNNALVDRYNELMPQRDEWRRVSRMLRANTPNVDCSGLEARVARSRRSSGRGDCTSNDPNLYHWFSAMNCGVVAPFHAGADPEGQARASCEAEVQRRSQDQRNYRGCRSGTPCVRGCGTALPAL